jgi:hypothetical protein
MALIRRFPYSFRRCYPTQPTLTTQNPLHPNRVHAGALRLEPLRLGAPLSELSFSALRAEEDELIVRVEVSLPAVLVGWQPDLATFRAPWDEGDLFGAHDQPTNAAMEVPTASIGFDPDETSSR